MSDKNMKDIRKQLKNVVKDMIDEILTKELCIAAYGQVQKNINDRLNQIDNEVKKSLDSIRDSSQNFQGYLMRELAAQAARNAEQSPADEATKPE